MEELRIGDGKMAQPGRKMRVYVEAADESGESYGSGNVTYLDPPFDVESWGTGVDSGYLPDEFVAAVSGMREDGARKFTLPAVTENMVRTATELRDGESHRQVIHYPRGVAVTFRVTLLKVCKPKFCSLTTYSIIDVGRHRQSSESSCK